MAEIAVPQSVVTTMPGSARLPAELARPSAERRSRLAAARAARGAGALWVTGPRSLRLSAIGARALPRLLLRSVKWTAHPALLAIVGALAVGGAAVAALLVTSAPSTAPHEAAKQAAVGSRKKAVALTRPRQSTHTRVKASRPHTTQRHTEPRHRRLPAKTDAHTIRSIDHTAASAPATTPATGVAASRVVEPTSVSSAAPSSSQTTDSGTAAQTPSSLAQTPSSSAASQGSGSQNPPAFGANGTLGPGSSPAG
jgi:hypothetical protein